jgi:hypothetical protein
MSQAQNSQVYTTQAEPTKFQTPNAHSSRTGRHTWEGIRIAEQQASRHRMQALQAQVSHLQADSRQAVFGSRQKEGRHGGNEPPIPTVPGSIKQRGNNRKQNHPKCSLIPLFQAPVPFPSSPPGTETALQAGTQSLQPPRDRGRRRMAEHPAQKASASPRHRMVAGRHV